MRGFYPVRIVPAMHLLPAAIGMPSLTVTLEELHEARREGARIGL